MSALNKQIGGDHYQTAIQPVEFIHANDMPYIEGCVVKYMVRWRKKGGIESLRKARHYIDLLIELELRAERIEPEKEPENAGGDKEKGDS